MECPSPMVGGLTRRHSMDKLQLLTNARGLGRMISFALRWVKWR